MYTPKFIKKEFQYSKGNEYMLGGEPYIGYYNITAKGPYTEKIFTDKSKRLFPIEFVLNEESQKYTELAENRGLVTDLEFDDPSYYKPEITEEDLKRGYVVRYFIKQRNDIAGRIQEIDKDQFDLLADQSAGLNPNYYKSVQLKWKITGPREDIIKNGIIQTPGVIGTNNRTILEKDKLMKGLYDRLVIKLDQFSIYTSLDNTNTDIEL